MSDGKLGIPLPDGARMFAFADGFICGWTFSDANAADKFETAEAARLAWEMSDKTRPDPFERIRVSPQSMAFGTAGFRGIFGHGNV
jgi:hypothetical protein